MATSVPGRPTFATASERDVWRRLCKQLGDDCVVLANYRVSDKHKDHEADLVALMPGPGIVVIEVKGSHVWMEPDGRWMINRANGAEPIHPVEQARDATYALRSYVTNDPRWGLRTPVRWSHHVVLARTELADDFATPDCPRWQISGKGDLADLGVRIWDTTSLHRTDARPPTGDDVDLIREILAGRSLPVRDPAAVAEDGLPSPIGSPWNRPTCCASPSCSTASRSAAEPAAARPYWPCGRRPTSQADVRGSGSGSRSSATATGSPTTCVVALRWGRGIGVRRSSGRSRISPAVGESRFPGTVSTPTTGRTGCPPRWRRGRPHCPKGNGSTR